VAVDDGSGAVAPSLETAKSGDCPLSRPLFTYPAESALANEHVAEFCDTSSNNPPTRRSSPSKSVTCRTVRRRWNHSWRNWKRRFPA
jgi:hypothetical protein